MFYEEILSWRFGKETSWTYIQEIPWFLDTWTLWLRYVIINTAVQNACGAAAGWVCLYTPFRPKVIPHPCSLPARGHLPTAQGFPGNPLPTGALLQTAGHSRDLCSSHIASPDTPWREVQHAQHLPFASVPKPACNFQEPTGDARSCRKGGPLLGPPWGVVCPHLIETTIFICFSKLLLINTRKLWLEAQRAQKADLERAFRFLR